MRWFVTMLSLALAISVPPALAQSTQSTKPDVSAAPGGQNSGAGVPGKAGSKSGPSVQSETIGSSATTKQENPTVRQQDPSNIQGMPGNKTARQRNVDNDLG